MEEGGAAHSAVTTSGGAITVSTQWTEPLSRAAVANILQYTPHIPSLSCAAAHPHLRYAREKVSGARAVGWGPHNRSNLHVCWDNVANCEYHRLWGTEEELEADLTRLGWWLTRPLTVYGEPMMMEVDVRPQTSFHSTLSPPFSLVAAAGEAPRTGFERILVILTQPPFQRTDVGVSCLRSLIVTHSRIDMSEAAMGLIAQLTHLENFESFADVSTLPLPLPPSLRAIRLHRVTSLTNFGALGDLPKLCRVSFSRCRSLCFLEALSRLTELSELHVANYRVLDVRGDYSACRRLTSVSIRRCSDVLHLGDLATLPALHSLDCSYSHLRDPWDLMQCTELRRLRLRGCPFIQYLFHATDAYSALREQTGSATAAAISTISIAEPSAAVASSFPRRAYEVQRFPTKSVTVVGTAAAAATAPPTPAFSFPILRDIASPCSTCFAQLEELDIGESHLVSLVGVTQRAPELRHLTVRECPQLRSLSPLGALLKLSALDASFSGIEDLEGLSESPSLQYVNLMNCICLRSALPLARVKSLREIDLSSMKQNCIICVHNVEVDRDSDRVSDRCAPRCRRGLIQKGWLTPTKPTGEMGKDRMCTAVTQRSHLGLTQHHLLRQEMENFLRRPLEQIRGAEAHPEGGAAVMRFVLEMPKVSTHS